MVNVNKEKLELKLMEMDKYPELKRAKTFVYNFFSTVGDQSLEHAYWNYLNDLKVYAPTNRAIQDNSTYLCFLFAEVTETPTERLAELEYQLNGPPRVYPIKNKKEQPGDITLEDILGPASKTPEENIISRYTALDAVRDGIFIKIGKIRDMPIYITTNLLMEYVTKEKVDLDRLEQIVKTGFELLNDDDSEDTKYMRLRVIEKKKAWVVWNQEGITFMRPEDY